jgi:ABC-type thiamin/hydroxymethylpyrimidine transport system permease subunit
VEANVARGRTRVAGRRIDWREDLRLNTMDIVVAVLLGIIEAAIEIVGALGFLERTVWLGGPAGFAFYAVYNGTTWILYFAGAWLRKRAGVILLGAIVTALVRWFFGDPDGPILLWYGIFPSIGALAVFYFMRWRGERTLFALSAAAAAALNQIALFVVLGGFDLAGNAFWGAVSVVMGFCGGLVWGVVARYLGMALARAGVPSVESVDDRSRGQGQGSYA